jgi:hypothetical protein
VDFSITLLECPHNMVTGFALVKDPEKTEGKEKAVMPPVTSSQWPHNVTSSFSCSLEASHEVQPTFGGEE